MSEDFSQLQGKSLKIRDEIELQGKLLKIRDEIEREFKSSQTCGPKELVTAIQKVNAISPFLELSEDGLRKLVDLAFQISLKKEESRYPRFQIYVPPARFLPINEELDWMVCFDPPITLDFSTLHRISSGMPSRPYALCVWESKKIIEAYGVIRIEDLNSQSARSSKHINVHCYPGLILSIEEPGILNVSLSNTCYTIIESLTLRYGRIERIYDPHMTPIVQSIYSDIEENIRSSEEEELSSNISGYIGNIWSYILSLSVDFEHGGQFIILPSDSSLIKGCLYVKDTDTEVLKVVLKVKHTTTRPNLGSQIAILDQGSASIQRGLRIIRNPSTGAKLPEDNHDSAFQRGVRQGLSIAEHIHDKYQSLFDSARAVAKLSTVDGCLVFNRAFQLLGCKGEILITEDKEDKEDKECCVILNPDYNTPRPKKTNDGKEITYDLNQHGTRHRSAARFCGKVPGAVVFVVSQDGDIRLFMHLGDKKVGVGGPFRPLPGLSPSIVHS